jgi:hypothetical protein
MMQVTPLVLEAHYRSRRFHAAIAERAKLITQRPERSYGAPALEPESPPKAPLIILRADFYYSNMWFYDLVKFVPILPEKVSFDLILRMVARHYHVSKMDIVSSRRTADIVRPRHVSMYLAKALTARSFPDIGRRFGKRDHTTVLHGFRKIERLMLTDEKLAAEITEIKRMIAA